MRIPYDVPAAVGREFIALAQEFAAAILRTLEAGWAHASSFPDVHAGAAEVEITERLRDGMRQALNDNRIPWSKMMVVLPGTESRSRPDVLRPDGRTAYVTCTRCDHVAEIDLERWKITRTFPVGNQPEGLAWSSFEDDLTSAK